MQNICKQLQKELKELEMIRKQVKKRLNQVPEGTLKVKEKKDL